MKHYKQGERIKDINELLEQNLVWWNGRVLSISFILGWKLYYVLCNMRHFYKVEKINSEEKNK